MLKATGTDKTVAWMGMQNANPREYLAGNNRRLAYKRDAEENRNRFCDTRITSFRICSVVCGIRFYDNFRLGRNAPPRRVAASARAPGEKHNSVSWPDFSQPRIRFATAWAAPGSGSVPNSIGGNVIREVNDPRAWIDLLRSFVRVKGNSLFLKSGTSGIPDFAHFLPDPELSECIRS